MVLEDCELLEVLGSGGEGVVWRALWQGAPVAVKVWHDTTGWSEAQLAGICQEVEVLRKLRHPHVVEFYGACTRPPHLCLVMEYAEGGTLSDLIHGGGGDGGGGLPPLRLLQLAEDVASALDYLHAARIVHRDLKPQNVLLSRAGRAAVTDFGIAKHKPGDFLSSQNLGAGTMAYMAPELFGGGAVDERCDQFSFGVVLWEMQSGGTPWKGMAAMQARGVHARGGCSWRLAADASARVAPSQIIMSVALERQRPELPRTCAAAACAGMLACVRADSAACAPVQVPQAAARAHRRAVVARAVGAPRVPARAPPPGADAQGVAGLSVSC